MALDARTACQTRPDRINSRLWVERLVATAANGRQQSSIRQSRAVLIGERAIERLVIQQRVARPGRPPEAAAFDKNLVGAALEVVGLVIFGKSRRHGGADAGADKDIERHAALAKRLVDAGMRGAEAAAAGRHESDRAAGQEADQAVDIELVLSATW